MKKKYVSPIFAELEICYEDVLFTSDGVTNGDNTGNSGGIDNGKWDDNESDFKG